MPPLKIDLTTDLTNEVIAEALPHSGGCRYSDPCVFGAMMPPAMREGLIGTIKSLVRNKLVAFPNQKQEQQADRLQFLFDAGRLREFHELVEEIRNGKT